MTFLFCGYRDWTLKLYEKILKKYKMELISSPKELTINKVKKINPEMIFFPDWSWMVPKKILEDYPCVCFHESNLPKFRGGSPIQNQIINGVKKTKTTAFFMDEGLDTGDIILKRDLSLEGSIEDIFQRMISNDYDMIVRIIKGEYKRKKQRGKPSTYKRRKPEESELKHLNHPNPYLYNFIRMLEDPYPNAFIRIGKKKIIFKHVKQEKDKLEFVGVIE